MEPSCSRRRQQEQSSAVTAPFSSRASTMCVCWPQSGCSHCAEYSLASPNCASPHTLISHVFSEMLNLRNAECSLNILLARVRVCVRVRQSIVVALRCLMRLVDLAHTACCT